MEKIRSGQPYLFREGGLHSTILDVRMKDNVKSSALHRALIQALVRFPYMSSKLVEKAGDYYLEEDRIAMIPAKTKKDRSLASVVTGYHLVDVTYFNNSIKIAFHHALCDGKGVKPFVETLVYYYGCYAKNQTLDANGVRLAGDALLENERTEPIGTTMLPFDESNIPHIQKEGYSLPEHQAQVDGYYKTEITMKQKEFIACAKANNATPAILLALLASESIQNTYHPKDKAVICSLACDYRQELGFEHTHKNCVGSIYLPYSKDIATLTLVQQATMYRNIIQEQKRKDVVISNVNAQVGLFAKLDTFETIQEKKLMLSFFNDLCIDTYVISYIGQFNFGGASSLVESVHLYSSGNKGLILNMSATQDNLSIDILQSFDSPSFVDAFTKQLLNKGIVFEKGNLEVFETACDKGEQTAKRQAERYYK